MPYNSGTTFIETTLFAKLINAYLSDDEYSALQHLLTVHPEAGDIVPGIGGLRKMRWGGSGRGKRRGLRTIYSWKARQDEIWLLALYAKNEAITIRPHILRQIAEEIRNG